MTEVTLPPLVTIAGVDLVAAGTWQLSTGETTFTPEDLANAIDAAQCPAVGSPVVKLGHVDPRFDGQPAVGRVKNMALAADGAKITGDLAGLPGWLGAVMSSAYPARSIEGAYDFTCQIGHVHPFVITGLALLGVSAPGVGVLDDLKDVAALYGLVAAGTARQTWLTLREDGEMVLAAGLTVEDVRRAYYDAGSTPYSSWITEMQLDPPQLIVCDDATSKIYRVPVTIKGGTVSFGDPVEVEIEYQDVAAAARFRKSLGVPVIAWASAGESREIVTAAWNASQQLKNMGDDPSASAIKKMFAIPGDTKSASKLPHHDCSSDGSVGAANDAGCSAGIGAINGAHGGLKGVSAAQQKAAYNHLASHLRSDGQEPPDYSGPAASAKERYDYAVRFKDAALRKVAAAQSDADDDPAELIASLDAILDQASALAEAAPDDDEALPPEVAQALDLLTGAEAIVDQLMDLLGIYDPDDDDDVAAAGGGPGPTHGAYTGTHSHPHAANGSQGGDETHDHSHMHDGDGNHGHSHASAGNAPQGAGRNKEEGGSDVAYTDEQKAQLRKLLGLSDGAELTDESILAGVTKLADSKVEAGAAVKLPDGVVLIDRDEWDATQARIGKMEKVEASRRVKERDDVIADAIRAGKFTAASRERWARVWDNDPEGTRAVIAGLAKNVVPVSDVGAAGGDEDEIDEEYRRLFPPSAQHQGSEG